MAARFALHTCIAKCWSNFQVIQFHEGRGEKRSEIALGIFDQAVHKQWAEQYPHKILKTDGDRVYQVANLYSQGDVCQETGAHR